MAIGRSWAFPALYLDAQRYAAWLSQETGQRYFLPSEAEWEYAAPAGSETPWNTVSAIISDDANILSQFGRTVPVGGYPPNAFGLYDTHGNVAEWTQACIDAGCVGAPSDVLAATAGNCAQTRVVRGCGWSDESRNARSAARAQGGSRSYDSVGFRVARAL